MKPRTYRLLLSKLAKKSDHRQLSPPRRTLEETVVRPLLHTQGAAVPT